MCKNSKGGYNPFKEALADQNYDWNGVSSMVKMWDITIPELTGDAKRLVYVYLPESYGTDPDRRYPVLYMFDGHNVFFDSHATYGKSWGMEKYMDQTRTQMIIVAVECNHGPNHARICEYAPYSFSDSYFGDIRGKGKIYMKWMVRELKPMIDASYRTLVGREHTMIAGSSMGGLMSLYAVLEYNDVFSRAACLSSSFHFCPDELNQLIRKVEISPDTIIYLDFGSEEIKAHRDMIEDYIRITGSLIRRDIFLETRIIPGGSHCEASWERQIPFFMRTLLYDGDSGSIDS